MIRKCCLEGPSVCVPASLRALPTRDVGLALQLVVLHLLPLSLPWYLA